MTSCDVFSILYIGSSTKLQPNTMLSAHPWKSSGQSYSSHLHGMLAWSTRENHLPLLRLTLEQGHAHDIWDKPYIADGLPALHVAARLNHTDAVAVLSAKCRGNMTDWQGRTPVWYASEKGHIGAVIQLVAMVNKIKFDKVNQLATSLNRPDNEGITPLGIAAQNGHTNVVGWLLTNAKANVNGAGHSQIAPLHLAAARGRYEVVQELISEGAKYNQAQDRLRVSPLHAAAYNGHADVVCSLLRSLPGVDVNLPDASQLETALHYAVHNGHADVVKDLLKHGADPNVESLSGSDPALRFAGVTGGSRTVNVFTCQDLLDPLSRMQGPIRSYQTQHSKTVTEMSMISGIRPLYIAVLAGHLECVQSLLKHPRIEINYQGPGARSALECVIHECCKLEKPHEKLDCAPIKILDILLADPRVDPNQPSTLEEPPLVYAIISQCLWVVRRLLTHRAINPNLLDINGRTLLHVAIEIGQQEIAELLLHLHQDKIKVNAQDGDGNTPLHIAASHGLHLIVKLLLEHGDVLVNLRSEGKDSPLSRAVEQSQALCVAMLLNHSYIDVNVAGGQNDGTPLHVVAGLGDDDEMLSIAELLLGRNDINLNSRDNLGDTPLSTAASRGNLMLVTLLLEWDGVDVNCRNHNGYTPLGYAAFENRFLIVEQLLNYPNINVNLGNKVYPLSSALDAIVDGKGDESVKALLGHPSNWIGMPDQYVLCRVIELGMEHFAVFEQLLERGDVNINQRNHEGREPLMVAAACLGGGREEYVKRLLDAGADTWSGYRFGLRNAMSLAHVGGDRQTTELIWTRHRQDERVNRLKGRTIDRERADAACEGGLHSEGLTRYSSHGDARMSK